MTLSNFPVGWGVEYTNCFSAEELDPTNYCPGYDTKQSDVEFPVILELWGMQSTHSLPSLLGLFWPIGLVPDRVISMGQIEINCIFMLNGITSNRTIFDIESVPVLN